MPPKASLENRRKIYQSLCYVLSDRANQVAWDEFTPADWDLFSQMADREGVAPLMYWKLKDSPVQVPNSTFNLLRSTYYQTLARNTLMYQELERILKALDEVGIPVIVLKGAALAATVYEDIGLRPMGDLDLLVSREDLASAAQIMAALGYKEVISLKDREIDWIVAHELQFKAESLNNITVEVHWGLIAGDSDWRSPASLDWFWEQTTRFRLPSVIVAQEAYRIDTSGDYLVGNNYGGQGLILTPSAHIVYSAAHMMLQHGGAKAQSVWFFDLHQLITYYRESLDWDTLLGRASEYEWEPALSSALINIHRIFNTGLPDGLTGKLKENEGFSVRSSWLVRRKSSKLQTLSTQEFERLLTLKPSARLKYVIALIIPSPTYMRWRYKPDPAWLLALWYPYRWLRILREAILTLLGIIFTNGT
jgi:hypothetical protein